MIHLCLFDCTIRELSPAHFDVESCCWHGHWSRIARLFGLVERADGRWYDQFWYGTTPTLYLYDAQKDCLHDDGEWQIPLEMQDPCLIVPRIAIFRCAISFIIH